MRVVSFRVAIVAMIVLAASLFVPPASAYSPPQAEYPDLGASSGVRFFAHKWTSALGAPTSLLDILPQGSPAAGDFNGDGWPDVFLPATRYTDAALDAGRDPSGRLYLNAGDMYRPGFILLEDHFVDVTDIAGVDARGFHYATSWADHDDDGDLDLFVAGYRSVKLFSNDGDSTFTDVTTALGLPQDGFTLGGAWGDYDADGDLDLFLAEFASYTHPDDGYVALGDATGRANRLLRNDGAGFTDVSSAAGIDSVARRTTSAAFVDFDDDGDLDVYATNYGEPAEAWRNDGGVFTESAAALGIADGARATCQAWEDLDRDGDLDLFVAHEDGVSDGVWLAGPGAFTDISGTLGLAATEPGDGWGCVAYDYDGDGDMDLATAHSGVTGAMAQRATLLQNRLDKPGGLFRYADVTPFADASNTNPPYNSMPDIADPMPMSGFATMDWDLNMEPDLVGVDNGGGGAHLFKSLGGVTWFPPGDAAHIRLIGDTDNHFGVGAKVRVTAGDLDITRQAGAHMAWGGQSSLPLHFGLFKAVNASYNGDPTPVDVTIEWPSGMVEHHPAIAAVPPMTLVFEQGGGYRLDMLPPRPQLKLAAGTEGGGGWYVSGTVSLDLTAKDPPNWNSARSGTKALRYSTDGATWTTAASPLSATRLTFSGDGTHSLWIQTEDNAGNTATILYPVRIDTTPPTFVVTTPAPGAVYVQGRAVGSVPIDRSVVVAPVVTDLATLGNAGALAQEAVGGDGWMEIVVAPSDDASGIARVDWVVRQTNGRIPPGMIGTAPFGPWSWDWPVYRAGPGEFRLTITVEDTAGHVTTGMHKVLIVPTHPDGITAQPSNPTP